MRGVAIYAAFFAAALMLFLLLPQLDLWVSGLFYARGRGFVLENWPPVIQVSRAIPWVAWGIVLIVTPGPRSGSFLLVDRYGGSTGRRCCSSPSRLRWVPDFSPTPC